MTRLKQVISSVALVTTLVLTGCTGGKSMTSLMPMVNPQSAALTVNMGDSPDDRIVALELTISSLSLINSSGNTVPVLKSPLELEIRNLAGTLRPISVTSVPAGTYTQAALQLSAAQITVLDPSTGQPVESNLPVPVTPISIKFASALVLTTEAATVNLDFNLAASVTIDPSGNITFSPTIVATTVMIPANENQEEDAEDGEVEEVMGAVTNVSGASFTIMTGQGPQTLTFLTDTATQFKGIGSLAGLTVGTIVEVHAITETNGTLLATKVDAEDEDDQDSAAEGLVVSTTGKPVTQFTLLVRDQTGESVTKSLLETTLTVNVDNTTQFEIDSDEIPLSGLNFTLLFDATSLVKGQNVEAEVNERDAEHEDDRSGTDDHSGGGAIAAKKVRLKQQALTGTVSGLNQGGTVTSFKLTVPSDSVFAMLTGQTMVTVFQQPSTQLKTVVMNGASVQVRGLLFFTSGKYDLVAGRILQP